VSSASSQLLVDFTLLLLRKSTTIRIACSSCFLYLKSRSVPIHTELNTKESFLKYSSQEQARLVPKVFPLFLLLRSSRIMFQEINKCLEFYCQIYMVDAYISRHRKSCRGKVQYPPNISLY
jgi:hypothetical protein